MIFDTTDAATLTRILQWRRDVRHFRTDPVDPAVISRLQSAMDLAPSVGNSRPWRVLNVQSPALRAAVRTNFETCNAKAANGYDAEKQAQYLALKLAGLDAAPLHLAIFTVTTPVAGHGLGRQTMPGTLVQSTAMAIHTLWLAARAENLGLGMVSILDPAALTGLFDLPADWVFSAYLCLGYPEFTDDLPLLHRQDWQENTPASWLTC